MRRYWLKIKLNGTWIAADRLVSGVQYYYSTLEEAKVASAVLKDKGYETDIRVSSNNVR